MAPCGFEPHREREEGEGDEDEERERQIADAVARLAYLEWVGAG